MSVTHLSKNTHRNKIMPPKRFHVLLLNDDYTPMDFVVNILTDIFHQPYDNAVQIMLQIHHQGKGLCGTYTRDIAETKQNQVLNLASQAGYPLLCIIEEEN